MTVCCLSASTSKDNQSKHLKTVDIKLTPSPSISSLNDESDVISNADTVSTEIIDDYETTCATSSLTVISPEPIQRRCLWANCGFDGFTMEDIYDHVIEAHIRSIKSQKAATATADKQKQKGCIDESDEIVCEWDDCDMEMSRGELCKKIEWLENHYRTRHASGVRIFKCLIADCQTRALTSKQLEEHVLRDHIEDETRKVAVKTRVVEATDPTNLEWSPPTYYPPFRGGTWLNLTINDRVGMMQRNKMARSAKTRYLSELPVKMRGSSRRKMGYKFWRPKRRLVVVDEEEKQEEMEAKSEEAFDIEKESNITLKDLFPDPDERRSQVRDVKSTQDEDNDKAPVLEAFPKFDEQVELIESRDSSCSPPNIVDEVEKPVKINTKEAWKKCESEYPQIDIANVLLSNPAFASLMALCQQAQ